MMTQSSTYRSKKWVILLLFGIIALSHWWVMPIFEIHDEGAHTGYIVALRETQQLPVYDRTQLPSSQYYGQEAAQPPLYYALAAVVTLPVSLADFSARWQPNPHTQAGIPGTTHNHNFFLHNWQAETFPWSGTVLAVRLARLLSILLAAGVLLLTHTFARTASGGNDLVADASMAILAFNPAYAHVAAGVNNDWAVVFFSSLALVLLAQRITEPARTSWKGTLLLALVTAAAVLSKLGGILLLPLFGWLLWWEWRQRRLSGRVALGHLVLFGTIIALLTGWWFVRNQVLYGDVTAAIVHRWFWQEDAQRTLSDLLPELQGVWISFWAVFGPFSFVLPGWVITFINLVTGFGLIGWAGMMLRDPRRLLSPMWVLTLLWIGLVIAGFVRWTLFIPASQGRLLYPAVTAWAFLMGSGLAAWAQWLPRRVFATLITASLAAFFLLSVGVPWLLLRPALTPPPYEVVADPSTAALPDSTIAIFGDELALSDTHVDRDCATTSREIATILPGNELCVRFSLQTLRALNQNHSLSIQVVLPHRTEGHVTQIDTYPAGGLLPTAGWQPGMRVQETYRLQIPEVVTQPEHSLVQLIVYDLPSFTRLVAIDPRDQASYGGAEVTVGEARFVPAQPITVTSQARISPIRFGDALTLIGAQVVPASTGWELRTTWRAEQDSTQDWQLFVHRVPAPGQPPIQTYDHTLGGQRFPARLWRQGDVVVDVTSLPGYPFAEPIVMGVYDGASGTRLPAMDGNRRLDVDAYVIPATARSELVP